MLVNDYMTDCVLLEPTSVPDGEGGQKTVWKSTVSFRAAIVQNAPSEVRRAEQQISAPGYTVTMPKTVPIVHGSVFRRREDDVTFRLTADPREVRSPVRASFSLMQAAAERWEVKE